MSSPEKSVAGTTRNYKMTVAYDGSAYHGWQIQPDKPTIQELIEQAIFQITEEHSRLAGAGRTDAGVHAIGQVASFHSSTQIPAERLRSAIQSQLPDDIIIRSVSEVPTDFHAGYAAIWKQYRYVILNSEIGWPHLRRLTTRVSTPLNIESMNAAANCLIGTHDFRSFESHFPNKATSVRTVHWCQLRRAEHWELWQPGLNSQSQLKLPGNYLFLDIVADGFLYNMVRAIMGTLLKIGTGNWAAESARQILEAQDRKLAGPTAPPEGLYLMHVEYDTPFSADVFRSFD